MAADPQASAAAGTAAAAAEVDLTSLSVKDLKAWISQRGGNMAGLVEKKELVDLARTLLATAPQQRQRQRQEQEQEQGQPRTGGGGSVAAFRGVNMPSPAALQAWGAKAATSGFVLVMLHGYGADNEQFNFLPQLLGAEERFFLVQPKSEGTGWFPLESILAGLTSPMGAVMTLQSLLTSSPPGMDVARNRVLTLVKELMRVGNVPARRIILGGFSQGATLALDCALEMDETVGGVLAFSGFPVHVDRWRQQAARHGSGLRVLSTHGRADALIPFMAAAFVRDALKGVSLQTVDHAGGHELGQESVATLVRVLAGSGGWS